MINLVKPHRVLVCGNPNCNNPISFKDPNIVSATINLPPVFDKQFIYCSQNCFDDAIESARRSPDFVSVQVRKLGDFPKRYSVFCVANEIRAEIKTRK